MNWSIQAELQAASGASTLEGALRKLKLLPPKDHLESLQVTTDWCKGGAESYIFCFDLYYAVAKPRRLIYKAFTPTYAGGLLEHQFSAIIQRRQLLAGKGVRIPQLYMAYKAAVLEDHIPYQLLEVIGNVSEDIRHTMLSDLLRYADALDELGFAPVAPFEGLRSDAQGTFVVDFGTDLGPPGVSTNKNQECRAALNKWLAMHNVSSISR